MALREWPLVVFTILAQMAAGLSLSLTVAHFLAATTYGIGMAEAFTEAALACVVFLLVLGGLFALCHLSRPLKAHWAMANLQSSWLSRESLLGLLFALAASLSAVVSHFEATPKGLTAALMLVTAATGVLLVYSMSRLYRLRTVPAWDTKATPVSFFATALLLGALALGVVLVIIDGAGNSGEATRSLAAPLMPWIAGVSALLVLTRILVGFLHAARLRAQRGPAAESVALLPSTCRPVLVTRLILAVLGMGVLSLFAVRPGMQVPPSSGLIPCAFALILASEVLGRFLFYASYKRVGF